MQMVSIYAKSKNPNLRYGFLFNFCGIKWILYRSAAGKHIVTCDAMQDLVMLNKCATVAELRKELIGIINKYYIKNSNVKTVLKDSETGVEIVRNKNDYYLNYGGESVLIENVTDTLNFCEWLRK